ncbi:MAG: cytochrome c3 family protein [Planctomycetota bacterium]
MTGLACLLLSCATAWADADAKRIPGPDDQGSCTDAACHAALVKRPVVHGPAGDGACDSCHESSDAEKHRFKLTAEGADLCTACHDAPAGKVKHDPVAQGACTACHDPHGSAAKHLLTRETVAQVCAECHTDITDGLRYLHGPVAAGACTACHNPHAADQPALLLGPGHELCLKCHQAIKDRLAGKSHPHAPAVDNCTGCHKPHGANDKMMLTAAPPALCFSCHDDLAKQVAGATVSHTAVSQGAACANCHEVHASAFASLLKQDGLTLCLSCHDRSLETPSGKLEDFKKWLADNPEHHGPVADGNCVGCHREVHGGKHVRLLAGEYPAAFYAPFDEKQYALCFECHDSDAFRDEKTTTRTGFRNGDQNLHYLHVNRRDKGRTCRACHQPHASKQPKLIADAVPFGEWKLPVRFQETPTGGSCLAGCHRRYRYDRESPVVNVAPTASQTPEPTTRPASLNG